jgi:[ribosomal protein S5]-alanine N-acetyltransferase
LISELVLPETFQTDRLTLRPIMREDAGPIFDAYAQDAEVTRYLIWRPHTNRSETESYVVDCIEAPPHVTRTYVLVDRGADEGVRGAFALRRVGLHRLDVGYVLARAWWGRGLMTEVLKDVADWALSEPSVFRIGAYCDIDNVASARVMEKAGLVREGLHRRWLVHPNISEAPRDCFSYARWR